MSCGIGGRVAASNISTRPGVCFGEKLPIQQPPSNMGPHRDDGSSGYGSPDSETFEAPQAQ